MPVLRRRMRRNLLGSAQRTTDRRAKSFYMVVVFVLFFVLMMLVEVLFVENNPSQEETFFSRLGLTNVRDPILPNPMARELALVLSDPISEVAEDLVPVMMSSSNFTPSHEVDHWQPVRHTKDKFFVFSAYYDDRRSRYVRVIAAARTRTADKVMCKFWFHNGERPVTVYATNRLIRENWNLKYSAYFVLCPLIPAVTRVPDVVSIQRHGETQAPSNRLSVHDHKALYPSPSGIAVCVKPLHYDYNKVISLVEFLEFNRLLGVAHVVLYNHTVGPHVGCTARHYQQENLVTVLPWQLDMVSQKEIRTEGLFAALNDCLYRTMYRFKYVLMIDLDEFIVPYKHASLEVLLRHLQEKNLDRAGAYSFQNSFFYLQWPDDRNASDLRISLTTLQKTRRKTKFHAHKQRSKCIVMPERVVEMGNHFVWEFLPGRSMRNISPDMAFLHHYRVCEFGGNDCVNTSSMVDRRVYAWRKPLVNAVTARIQQLQTLCQFPSNVTGQSS